MKGDGDSCAEGVLLDVAVLVGSPGSHNGFKDQGHEQVKEEGGGGVSLTDSPVDPEVLGWSVW